MTSAYDYNCCQLNVLSSDRRHSLTTMPLSREPAGDFSFYLFKIFLAEIDM